MGVVMAVDVGGRAADALFELLELSAELTSDLLRRRALMGAGFEPAETSLVVDELGQRLTRAGGCANVRTK